MGAAYTVDPDTMTSERIYEILSELDRISPLQFFPAQDVGIPVNEFDCRLVDSPAPAFLTPPLTAPAEPQPAVLHLTVGDAAALPGGFALQLVLDRADIDISGPEFNFVRSIRVFGSRFVRQWESGEEGDCNRMASVSMGSYGSLGDLHWSGSSLDALPEAHLGTERYSERCSSLWHRSVFVEWRDYEGNYGYEQVNY